MVNKLRSGDEYDLIIVGGGATGTGCAVDAASRGLKVALVERDDFASGTSSRSTKLVHGGVRYLEKAFKELDYDQYKLVKEALHERKAFLHIAPHLSFELPIMIPIYKWWQAPYFWAGTKMYDFLAGSENMSSSYYMTKSRAKSTFPMLKADNLVGALVYFDGQHNDSRMNVGLAVTAIDQGADVVNHTEVTSLSKDASGKRLNGVRVKDLITGESYDIKAKGIINATGPFTDALRKMDDQSVDEIVAPSSGTHIILPGYFAPESMGLLDPNTSDGRVIFFLPWQGNTIAGTTDAPTKVMANPLPKEEEIDWILSECRNYLKPTVEIRRGDVLAAWSGIRPLVRDPAAKNTESLVRNHMINVSPSGLLTIAGGKWTTYRQMAEETIDTAISEYSLQPKLDHCVSENVRLIGAEYWHPLLYINLVQQFGLETDVAKHLCESYGDRAFVVASLAEQTEARWPIRGKRLSTSYPFDEAEIRYAVRHEYAQSAMDVLARRTRLAFLNAQASLEVLPRVIDIMTEELSWSKARREQEWTDGVQFLLTMGLPAIRENITRKEVESGKTRVMKAGEYKLYSRADGPEGIDVNQDLATANSPQVEKEKEKVGYSV
ncbi:FAD dependent oxidoreductase-domain-containing protein [Protomyces lactucae-debilis]|uniref:Glycerol-3-phosphate dehydrogenase n=1 Tax=Protomyces lactucae-debilis TaxID=2754530 RepID=A0A1Y2FK10_PROLT|nr:FAD dependent oxidoreductase-domain-containing protein [Protomyces lactucae-debilis]ORY83125.1 FAD dependent oxidoreductase-domain-containing protein [Protomyces lactucae-debilis]